MWILTSFSPCIHCRLNKAGKAFQGSILNEAMTLSAFESEMKIKLQKWCEDCSTDQLEARYLHSSRLSQQFVVFSKLFHEVSNIRARNRRVFENRWKCFQYVFQVIWSSKVTLNVTKHITNASVSQEFLESQYLF